MYFIFKHSPPSSRFADITWAASRWKPVLLIPGGTISWPWPCCHVDLPEKWGNSTVTDMSSWSYSGSLHTSAKAQLYLSTLWTMEKEAEEEITEGITKWQKRRGRNSKWLFIRVAFRYDLWERMFSLHLRGLKSHREMIPQWHNSNTFSCVWKYFTDITIRDGLRVDFQKCDGCLQSHTASFIWAESLGGNGACGYGLGQAPASQGAHPAIDIWPRRPVKCSRVRFRPCKKTPFCEEAFFFHQPDCPLISLSLFMGWIVSSPNSYVEALTPSSSECDYILYLKIALLKRGLN